MKFLVLMTMGSLALLGLNNNVRGQAPELKPIHAVKVTAEMERFSKLTDFPSATVEAVFSFRTAAHWLGKMNQANGFFIPALHPTLRKTLRHGDFVDQAWACFAMVAAARFSGEEKIDTIATQALLSLWAVTKNTKNEIDLQTLPSVRDRLQFVSLLCLASNTLARKNPTLLEATQKGYQYLKARLDTKGKILDQTTYPGLVYFALLQASDKDLQKSLQEGMLTLAENQSQQLSLPVAASLLWPLAHWAEKSPKEAGREMLDKLCQKLLTKQYTLNDASSPTWVGGFKPVAGDRPDEHSFMAMMGLLMATRQASLRGDLTTFQRYQQAAFLGMNYFKPLQFSEENTLHFNKDFRQQFLLGGVHDHPDSGIPNIQATSWFLLLQMHFLTSGLENK